MTNNIVDRTRQNRWLPVGGGGGGGGGGGAESNV